MNDAPGEHKKATTEATSCGALQERKNHICIDRDNLRGPTARGAWSKSTARWHLRAKLRYRTLSSPESAHRRPVLGSLPESRVFQDL